MTQRISPSYKRRKVSIVRDFPRFSVKDQRSDDVAAIRETKENLYGSEDRNCVGGVAHQNHHRLKEVESFDSIMKKAGFNVAGNVGNGIFAPSRRKVPLLCESKVKPLSVEEGIKLMGSESQRRRRFGKPLVSKAVQKRRCSPAKKLCNATALRVRANAVVQKKHRYSPAKKKFSDAHRPRLSNQLGVLSDIQRNRLSKDLSPREKVQELLRVFKLVFDELDRNKAARRGESEIAKSRIDYQTRNILREMGMQVNCHKRIGPVPGIEVGDKIQFKAALNVIGLHFDIMGGIDYMKKGNKEVATSIVSSEGNDYGDRFINDVMIYCGQGGNVKSKDQKAIKDQKLVGGNLALANSIKEKTPVRVIRGERRLDHRGKDYVYDGLYMVEKYRKERGPLGNILFKFELRRKAGQPYVDF